MDELNIPYSQKNIPLHSKTSIRKQLVKRTEDFVSRMRWHLYHIRNPNPNNNDKKTFGFRTTTTAPFMDELKDFENDLFKMINNVKFKPTNSNLQDQMKKDVQQIEQSDKVFVNGDKSRRIYKMEKDDYNKMVKDNITSKYRKSDRNRVDEVNREAAGIARKLDLVDRIDAMTESQAMITIKDHKDNFPQRIENRLINRSKTSIGKISKDILDRINCQVRLATNLNQFKSTNEVISWFKNLQDKNRRRFIKLDICEFYPSITLELLTDALDWAKQYVHITDEEKSIIIHCRRNFLFFQNDIYVKKDNPDFDNGQGSLDSAEVSELVGLFILHKQEDLIKKESTALFRDDMIIAEKLTGRECNLMEKKLRALFRTFGLKITVESNLLNVNFLDINLNLVDGTYRPYRKNNDVPVYISKSSNHPPAIKKGLVQMIGYRISDLSSNEEIFNSVAPIYNQGLRNSGFTEEIKYEPNRPRNPRRRRRKVIYFNPPWDDQIKTNLGACFLRLVDKHFRPGTDIHSIFNRQKVKVSYSNMPNIKRIISGHNNKIVSPQSELTLQGCNCNGGVQSCMLGGHCLTKSLVYKGEVKYQIHNPRTGINENKTKHYVGLASTTFKERYKNHKHNIDNAASKGTALSSHIWRLKNQNINFDLKFSILKLCKVYSRESKSCDLCLTEKTIIMFSNHYLTPNHTDHFSTLNKRSEILQKCRHRAKHTLEQW